MSLKDSYVVAVYEDPRMMALKFQELGRINDMICKHVLGSQL